MAHPRTSGGEPSGSMRHLMAPLDCWHASAARSQVGGSAALMSSARVSAQHGPRPWRLPGVVRRCTNEGMTQPGPDPDNYPPIDPSEPVPDDPGELSPDTPETLPPAPVEPMPGPDDPTSVPA